MAVRLTPRRLYEAVLEATPKLDGILEASVALELRSDFEVVSAFKTVIGLGFAWKAFRLHPGHARVSSGRSANTGCARRARGYDAEDSKESEARAHPAEVCTGGADRACLSSLGKLARGPRRTHNGSMRAKHLGLFATAFLASASVVVMVFAPQACAPSPPGTSYFASDDAGGEGPPFAADAFIFIVDVGPVGVPGFSDGSAGPLFSVGDLGDCSGEVAMMIQASECGTCTGGAYALCDGLIYSMCSCDLPPGYTLSEGGATDGGATDAATDETGLQDAVAEDVSADGSAAPDANAEDAMPHVGPR